jgi:hypothetical protein
VLFGPIKSRVFQGALLLIGVWSVSGVSVTYLRLIHWLFALSLFLQLGISLAGSLCVPSDLQIPSASGITTSNKLQFHTAIFTSKVMHTWHRLQLITTAAEYNGLSLFPRAAGN